MERSSLMKMKTTVPSSLSRSDDMEQPSVPYISFPQKAATIRDASFSSYLKPEQEPNNRIDDSELSIFDAQKYFNEIGNDPKASKRVSPVHANVIGLSRISAEGYELSSVPRFSSASSSVHGYSRNYRARSFRATPTASSEASWNSQTGLLSNPPGAMAISVRNPPPNDDKKRGSAAKWLLRRRCPCSGKKSIQVEDNSKKSVQVEEKLSELRTPIPQNQSLKASLDLKKQILNPIESRGHRTVMVPEKGSGDFLENIAAANKKSSVATSDQWLENREAITSFIRISTDSSHNQCPTSTGLGHQGVLAPGCGPFGERTTGSTTFTFPILGQTSAPLKPLVLINGLPSTSTNISHTLDLEDPPRDSLEVFRPSDEPIPTKITMTTEPHRRLSFTFPGSPNSRMATTITDDDHDIASDASSDLFEIESFSTTQTTSYPYPILFNNNDSSSSSSNNNRRYYLDDEASSFKARRMASANIGAEGATHGNRGLDNQEPMMMMMMMRPSILMPPLTETECYAPSEASIDWSVTTAEGFDRAGSVANFSVSASEAAAAIPEEETTTMRHVVRELQEKGHGGGSGKRNGGGGLLSCRCEKAVSVGPQPVKCVGGDEGQRLAISTTTRHVHVGSTSRPAFASKP